MKIYFARHGESQANLLHMISNRGLSYGLTPKGREQAAALAEYLFDRPITHIFTSPVLRAVETSAIVAQRLELNYVVVDALREYDCGSLEGRSDEAAWQQWQELFDAWVFHCRYDMHIDGGESFNEICQRFVPFITELLRHYAGTQAEILCVSHEGIYTLMLPLVIKNVDDALITNKGFDYTSCIVAELQLGGLTCVEWNGHPINLAPRQQ